MSDDKISIMSEKFENEKTGELVEGITIVVDGKLKQILDIISLNEGYKDYTEAVKEVFFSGIECYIKK